MLTLNDLLEATSGKLLGNSKNIRIKGISTDTRMVKPGEAFIALCGDRFDGHKFLKKAIQNGARSIVISKRTKSLPDVPAILVKDTTKALGDIARFYRRRFSIPIIAITGSAGKTTTKEMIASVLGTQFTTLKNLKTENNHIGVPSTLLRLRSSHQAAVLELGTNHPGEIRYLASIAQPTMAVFTNIGASHLEGLKTIAGVYREKKQLLNYLSPAGAIVYNADDPYLRKIKNAGFLQKKISYGIQSPARYTARKIQVLKNRSLHFYARGKKYHLDSMAGHNVYNALSAICCGELLGIRYNNIYKSLRSFSGNDGRQNLLRLGSIVVVDDTYNANPVSVKAAVQALEAFQNQGRKILVCADMLELGKKSKYWHEHIGGVLNRSKVSMVLTHGRFAKYMSDKFRCDHNRQARHFSKIEDICSYLNRSIQPGDVILVKGSRGMRMERVVECLRDKLMRKK